MNKMLFLTATLLVTSFSINSFASNEVSGFEKGILCRAIESKYEKQMLKERHRPKWMTCREDAIFNLQEEVYMILTPGKDSRLSCKARLENGIARNPIVAQLSCTNYFRK